jgi:hypothetical protein
MLFRSVHTEAICSNFELASSVAKRHERQDPNQNADGFALGVVSLRKRGAHKNNKLTCTLLKVAVSTALHHQHVESPPKRTNIPANSREANFQSRRAVKTQS